jgi:hypothetical protein
MARIKVKILKFTFWHPLVRVLQPVLERGHSEVGFGLESEASEFDRESDAATEIDDDERLRRRKIGCEAKSENDPESSSELKSFVLKEF